MSYWYFGKNYDPSIFFFLSSKIFSSANILSLFSFSRRSYRSVRLSLISSMTWARYSLICASLSDEPMPVSATIVDCCSFVSLTTLFTNSPYMCAVPIRSSSLDSLASNVLIDSRNFTSWDTDNAEQKIPTNIRKEENPKREIVGSPNGG